MSVATLASRGVGFVKVWVIDWPSARLPKSVASAGSGVASPLLTTWPLPNTATSGAATSTCTSALALLLVGVMSPVAAIVAMFVRVLVPSAGLTWRVGLDLDKIEASHEQGVLTITVLVAERAKQLQDRDHRGRRCPGDRVRIGRGLNFRCPAGRACRPAGPSPASLWHLFGHYGSPRRSGPSGQG